MNDNMDNGQSFEGEDFDALAQFAAGGEQQPEPTALPEKFGNVAFVEFEKAIVEATGGTVKGFEDFKQVLASREKFSTLEKDYQTLKEQEQAFKGGPKYANELSQKIDDMYRNGVSEDNIMDFIKLQRMDVNAMDDKDVMKNVFKREYPQFSDEELDQMIEEEFDGSSLKLKKAAIEGRKTLEQLKVNIQEPENVRMQKAQTEQLQARFTKWATVTDTVWGKKEQHTFDIEIGDDKSAFNFAVPEETRKVLSIELAKYATQHGIPATAEGFKALQEVGERMLLFKHGKEIMATLFRDVDAQTRSKILANVHNTNPAGRGDGGQKKDINLNLSEAELQKKRIAQEGMSGRWG